MFKKTARLTAVAGLALAGTASAATINISDALVPTGLGVGDTFHLAFTTTTTVTQNTGGGTQLATDPQWAIIANWDAVVQSDADAGGVGTSAGLSWNVIGSTSTVDASRDLHAMTIRRPLVAGQNTIEFDIMDRRSLGFAASGLRVKLSLQPD